VSTIAPYHRAKGGNQLIKEKVDKLLVSDVHLGSGLTRAKELRDTIERHDFNDLLCLGDIFHLPNVVLPRDEQYLADYILDRAIILGGNHDEHFVPGLLEYKWSYEGKRFGAKHGHESNRVLQCLPILSIVGANLQRAAHILDFTHGKRLSQTLHDFEVRWFDRSQRVAARAAADARLDEQCYTFRGHTHVAAHYDFGDVQYFNTGSWTQKQCTYITVGEQGVRLHDQTGRVMHSHSCEERAADHWEAA